MSNIEEAVGVWSDAVADAYDIIFSNPSDWNNGIWNIVTGLNATLTIVGSSLLACVFIIGMLKQTTDLKQLAQPSYWFEPLIKLALANLFLVNSLSLLMYIFSVVQGIMHKIGNVGSGRYDISVPSAVSEALEEVSFFKDMSLGVIGLLLQLLCLVLGVLLMVLVWGRFLRIYLYTATAPVFIAFGGGEATFSVAITFIKSWLAECFKGMIILLALIIYSALIESDNSKAIDLIEAGAVYSGILEYTKDFAIGALVTIGLCKEADSIVTKMTGY